MLPCAGQGALGIEIRSGATALRERLAALDDAPTALATQAERAVSRALGGSCSTPLAAFAIWEGDSLLLRASLGHPTATDAALLRAEARDRIATAEDAEALGQRAAGALRQQGADGLSRRRGRLTGGDAGHRHTTACASGRVGRSPARARARGGRAAADRDRAARRLAAVADSFASLADRRLVVFVSPNAVLQFFARAPAGWCWPALTRAASPGPGTTRSLVALGVPPRADRCARCRRAAVRFGSAVADLAVAGLARRAGASGAWTARSRLACRATRRAGCRRRHAGRLRAQDAAARRRPRARCSRKRWPSRAATCGCSAARRRSIICRTLMRRSRRGPDDAIWRASHALATHPRIAQARTRGRLRSRSRESADARTPWSPAYNRFDRE